MKPLISLRTPTTLGALPFSISARWMSPVLLLRRGRGRLLGQCCFTSLSSTSTHGFTVRSLPAQNRSFEFSDQTPQTRKTLFPGGYKRPEITVPGILLWIDAEDLLDVGRKGDALDLIDRAVAKSVGIIVLDGGAGGGRLYEAACLLKSIIKGRAYLLITERVDIATSVGASGVALSDAGLPAIVARNTMTNFNSESVVLPLVAKTVQDVDSALNASSSEGADFLIYSSGENKHAEMGMSSIFQKVKIPIFSTISSVTSVETSTEGARLLKLGAGGFVVSLEDLKSSRDDVLCQLIDGVHAVNSGTQNDAESFAKQSSYGVDDALQGRKGFSGFINMEEREKKIIETEKSVLEDTIKVIQKAAPLMEEVSLLVDAVSRIDEPFLLVIVGEFNSGKSTVINALLGKRYLKEGVVPTTNEITFLCYAELESEEQQRCERHPDGQYICYLPAPILKDINIVDTPGTNVILQRQQRLTEEFVPRADLLLFILSADRPLTESEVAFLRYTQQWKKKSVFVLNKSDIYLDVHELEEAISFIKENAQKLLNTEDIMLYPVSARSALEAKLSGFSIDDGHYDADSQRRTQSFHELEKFLYSFLDKTTTNGMERMKLKLETPIAIADRLLSAAESLIRQDCSSAKQDLALANKIVDGVNEYALKMESESISWRRQALSVLDATKLRAVELVESTLQLSNLDLVASYILKGENSATTAATSKIQNEILSPALLDAQKLLGEYITWLQSNNAHEGRLAKESFENKLPVVNMKSQLQMDTYDLLRKVDEFSPKVVQNLNSAATSKLLEKEIREVFIGTFGGLGAAGLSASLLTSVLPTTLEDLLALGLCSAGGYVAIANFPNRRQAIVNKVNRSADSLAQQLEDAMQKDLLETVSNLEKFVKVIGRPYQEEAQGRLDRLLAIQTELSLVKSQLQKLQIDIQNLHVSQDEIKL